jgi:O-antigen/teichoic acid export membrane protein
VSISSKLKELVRNKFLRDTGTLQVGAAMVSVGNFVSAAGLALLLGSTSQGEFYVAISLYSLLWFTVNLGLVSVAVSHISAGLAKKDLGEASSWLAYLLKAYAVLGGAVGIVGVLVLPWIAVNVLDARYEVGVYAGILAFTPLIDLPRVVACAGFQGARRMIPLAQSDNGFEFVRVFLVLTGALITGDMRGPAIGSLLASAVGSLLAMDLYHRECKLQPNLIPSLGSILRHVRDVPLTKGLAVGMRMGAVQNLAALGGQILPALLLQTFGSPAWVAYLRIAQRIMAVPLMAMKAISRTALPAMAELAGAKDMRRLCQTYFRTSLYSGLIISSGLLMMLPFLPFVLSKAFPVDFRDPIWTICLILTPGFMVISFSIANDTFYLITKTLRIGIIVSVVGALINLPLIAALAWKFPTVGVAWGLSISMFWSLWHPIYVYGWYRKNVVAPDEAAKLS